jgi:hypothetical protein
MAETTQTNKFTGFLSKCAGLPDFIGWFYAFPIFLFLLMVFF